MIGKLPRRLLLLTSVVGILLGGAALAFAETVTVAWDPNPPEENVTGYLLYYGSVSRSDPSFTSYDTVVDVQSATEWTGDVGSLAAPKYFAVVAYNGSGLQSDYSVEISTADTTNQLWSITTTVEGPGTVTPGGVVQVADGLSQSFTFAPQQGASVDDVQVDGVSMGGNLTTYNFAAIHENHSLFVRFAAPPAVTYTVAATAGANGSITPSGSVTVAAGGSQTFTISAGTGYQVDDVQVDGASVGALSSYTFSNMAGDHTIAAAFAPLNEPAASYSITATAGANGTITPSGSVSVAADGSQTFTISADTGYQVADVLVDGKSEGPLSSYTFSGVSANHLIEARFTLPDTDGDGIPDSWEMQYFGDLSAQASQDSDGDGISNYQEYVNGTDPRVPDTVAELTPAVAGPVSGGTVTSVSPELSVYDPLNPNGETLTYQFQVASDKAMTAVVDSVEGVAEGVGVTNWAVTAALADQSRYYWRARVTTGAASSDWTPVCTFYVDTAGQATTAEVDTAGYVTSGADTIIEVTDPTKRANRVAVDLPAGTLPYDFVLTVGTVDNAPTPSGSSRLLGKVYEFGPHGTTFDNPVTVLLPYADEDLQGAQVAQPSDLGVLTYNTDTLAWESVPVEAVDYLGKRLVCKVQHFSMYAISYSGDGSSNPNPETPPSSGGATPPATAASGGGGGGGCFIQSLW